MGLVVGKNWLYKAKIIKLSELALVDIFACRFVRGSVKHLMNPNSV